MSLMRSHPRFTVALLLVLALVGLLLAPMRSYAGREVEVKVIESAQQFSDSPRQLRADVRKVFAARPLVAGFTEVLKPRLKSALQSEARRAGYRLLTGRNVCCALAVRGDAQVARWGNTPVLPRMRVRGQATGPRGVLWARVHWQGESMWFGHVHALPREHEARARVWLNEQLLDRARDMAVERSRGPALAFLLGDFNRWGPRLRVDPLVKAHRERDVVNILKKRGDVRVRLVHRRWGPPRHSDHRMFVAKYRIER